MTRKQKIRPDDTKLAELILLISEYSQADKKFGAIKLNKLLFYCDFNAYLSHGVPITGQQYFALPQGPAPKRLKPVIERMKRNEQLAYQLVAYHGFTARQIDLIHRILEKCWNKSAIEISDESHLFWGWKVARPREVIPYSTALVGKRLPTAQEREHGLALQPLAEELLRAHR
jgi:uncharacterized phage-associated protein